MARLPAAPPGDRIFARVDRFDCACPACGEVIRGNLTPRPEGAAVAELGKQQRRGKLARGVRANQATAYNPLTSTLRCPSCRTVYQVGLILWPVATGRQQYLIPEDQRPTRAELRRIRQYATGFVAEAHKRRGDSVNVYVTAECCCPVAEGGWAPRCPIHGWEQVRAAIGAGGPEGGPDDADQE